MRLWHGDGGNHLAGRERIVRSAIPAITKEACNRQVRAPVRRDDGVTSQKGRSERGGMGRNAWAKIERNRIESITAPGRARAAALFQAGKGRIAEVPAARTLPQVAANGRNCPNLRRCQRVCGGGDPRIGGAQSWISCKGCDRDQTADADGAIQRERDG